MLVADNITVTFTNRRVLNSVNLAVAAGEIVAVLGASGSGKSTLLRSLCGLQPVDAGRVAWRSTDGVDTELTSVAAHRRSVGMMFQDHLLFPHLDVARNVAYGLATGAGSSTFGRRGVDGRRGRHREDDAVVRDLLAIVGLQGFEERQIATLSGGEQQRVALARSLAPQPRALLLDEPFGALDRGRREQLVDDVARIVRSRNVATIVVTHDHDEAFTLADRIAVLVDGCIVQLDTAHKVWVAPASIEVCQLLGFGSPETVWCGPDDNAPR